MHINFEQVSVNEKPKEKKTANMIIVGSLDNKIKHKTTPSFCSKKKKINKK